MRLMQQKSSYSHNRFYHKRIYTDYSMSQILSTIKFKICRRSGRLLFDSCIKRVIMCIISWNCL